MSAESIVYERRSNFGDDGGDLVDQEEENDGGSVKPRRAFERNRSWKESERAKSRSSSQASGKHRAGPPAVLKRYAHNFFSEEMAACRRAYFKLIVRATILTIILTWACLPIYWGSLSSSASLTGSLEAWVVNRDPARIGNTLESTVLAAPTSGPGALWWRLVNASHFPDDEAIMQAVIEERTWLAVVVSKNATDSLTLARSVGNASYDPSSIITVYYAQARNEVVTGTYLLPAATALLSNFTTSFATGSAQRYLAAIVAQDGSVNLTALNGIAQAPQTISPGIGYSMVNLRPYTTPVAQAPLLVGQIYLCIFAFILVMAHSTARKRIEKYLTFPSYVTIRIIVPLLYYFPLSLSYSLVSLAFGIPFGTHFTFGAGFLAFFGYLYLGMTSLGLALEAMITLLKPKFVPFFLVLLIIVNISTAALTPELQPRLYGYGIGFQFWNIQQALRTIIFNTNSHLSQNAGILIAWLLISCGTTTLFTWLLRARDVRRVRRFDSEHGDAGTRNPKGKGVDTVEDKNWEARVNEMASVDEKMKKKGTTAAFNRWEKLKCGKSKNQDGQNAEKDGLAGESTDPPILEHSRSSL